MSNFGMFAMRSHAFSLPCNMKQQGVDFNFLFYIRVQLIDNIVLVSSVQQSDLAIHIYVSILFQILSPFRLLQNIEQSSLCYTVGPC